MVYFAIETERVMKRYLSIVLMTVFSIVCVSCDVVKETNAMATYEDNIKTNCTWLKKCGMPVVGNSVEMCVKFMTTEKNLPEYTIKACRDYHLTSLAMGAQCEADMFKKYGEKYCDRHNQKLMEEKEHCLENAGFNQKQKALEECMCSHMDDYKKTTKEQHLITYLESKCGQK